MPIRGLWGPPIEPSEFTADAKDVAIGLNCVYVRATVFKDQENSAWL